jgi:hypothetical protein
MAYEKGIYNFDDGSDEPNNVVKRPQAKLL